VSTNLEIKHGKVLSTQLLKWINNGLKVLYTHSKGWVLLMDDEGASLYDRLPVEMLAGFYYHINKNIENGVLTNAMYHEIDLIKQVAIKKGISLTYLYNQGSLMK